MDEKDKPLEGHLGKSMTYLYEYAFQHLRDLNWIGEEAGSYWEIDPRAKANFNDCIQNIVDRAKGNVSTSKPPAPIGNLPQIAYDAYQASLERSAEWPWSKLEPGYQKAWEAVVAHLQEEMTYDTLMTDLNRLWTENMELEEVNSQLKRKIEQLEEKISQLKRKIEQLEEDPDSDSESAELKELIIKMVKEIYD